MRRFALCLCLLIAGCSRGGDLAGTYHSQGTPRQMILNGDGTFRLMYGERTSANDQSGTYRRVGDSIVFTAKAPPNGSISSKTPLPEAKITEDGFTLGSERFGRS